MTGDYSGPTAPVSPGGSTLSPAQVDALRLGRHGDPFSLLGPHANPAGDGLVVRVLLPWARAVAVRARDSGKKPVELRRIHHDGLFEGLLGERTLPFDYDLEVTGSDGIVTLEDPYRFAPSLVATDFYHFNEGTEQEAWRLLGAHPLRLGSVDGVRFAVWAPGASRVSVVGDFNAWDARIHGMRLHPASGVWEIFIPGVVEQSLYKYQLLDGQGSSLPLKADPYALSMQHPPETASRVLPRSSYTWTDRDWIEKRASRPARDGAMSIYEVHAGSWRRKVQEGNRYLSYRELGDELIPYVREQGFTHIQLMPVSEYPFDGSWGYQPVGLYAPSIRYGTPDEFREFVDRCHADGIGVLLDWVPGHFPTDPHGLGGFDGTALYEHEDRRRGFHPDWNTLIYNYGRCEVLSFLISNANFWLEEFHVDGLRIDAVASMLYLDYSRKEGEWLPNHRGGRENLEAIHLLSTLNDRLRARHPGIVMIAEESTAWPGVTGPVEHGGLGFDFKWNMGWMNDSLRYMERAPVHRQHHHDEMTFSTVYAWDENFVLSLSHDEVVHGKGSLLGKMPGDEWQKFANLRAYLGFMWGHPGKKLLFMGNELAQVAEWNHDRELDWHLLQAGSHRGVQTLVRDLNRLYRERAALHVWDCEARGFTWVQGNCHQLSIFAWLRFAPNGEPPVLVVCNMTPVPRHGYRVGVPAPGRYRECMNTDACEYGGSGLGNHGAAWADEVPADGQPCSLELTLPPLASLMLTLEPATAGS